MNIETYNDYSVRDVLKIILDEADIPYNIGIGPKGIVYQIEKKFDKKFKAEYDDWKIAINKISNNF